MNKKEIIHTSNIDIYIESVIDFIKRHEKAYNKMDDSQYMPFSNLVTSLDDADRVIKNMQKCKVLSMKSLDYRERAVALIERMKAI
jgi:hypothetical protein